MRIAIANRLISGVTGATSIIFEHARRMAALGWAVQLFAESIDSKRARAVGASPHRVLRWPWGSYLKRRLFASLAARKLASGKFDLVFGHGDLLDQDVLFLHNCVHAAHEAVHGRPLPEDSGVGRIHSRILRERRFKRVVANSQLMAEELRGRFAVPGDQIRVVYPGFDPARFKTTDRERLGSAVRTRLGVPTGELLSGLITSGDFQKRGVDIFLQALNRLPAETKRRTHALIMGREARLDPYRRLAAETGLGERVHFLDPEPEIAPYFHALDVYVFPCRYEEFGMSGLEAMACGVPMLTTARTGVSELLTGEAKDALARAPEPESLASSLHALLESPDMRRRWSAEASAAVAGFTWDRHWDRFRDVCRSVLPENPMV